MSLLANTQIIVYNHNDQINMTMVIFMKKKQQVIQAGEFKAKCLQLMDKVKGTHITIIITKHGKPVAMLVPIKHKKIDKFGCLKDTVTIVGDIIEPIDVDWEANE